MQLLHLALALALLTGMSSAGVGNCCMLLPHLNREVAQACVFVHVQLLTACDCCSAGSMHGEGDAVCGRLSGLMSCAV